MNLQGGNFKQKKIRAQQCHSDFEHLHDKLVDLNGYSGDLLEAGWACLSASSTRFLLASQEISFFKCDLGFS